MAERSLKYFDTETGLWTDFSSSDTIPATAVPGGGSATEVYQTEIDFGATPVQEQSFTISHVGADSTSKIIASVAYDIATGKDLDEMEMDDLIIKCGNPAADSFTMFVRSADGSYLSGTFKVNYIIFNTAV